MRDFLERLGRSFIELGKYLMVLSGFIGAIYLSFLAIVWMVNNLPSTLTGAIAFCFLVGATLFMAYQLYLEIFR